MGAGLIPLTQSGQSNLRNSVNQIICTDIQERPFVKRNGIPFGTRIRRSLFSDTDSVQDMVKFECKRALDLWEPRIIVDSVTTSVVDDGRGGSKVVGFITARERATGQPLSFVIPFQTGSGQ